MKRFLTKLAALSTLSVLATAPIFMTVGQASAQPTNRPTGTRGSYIGAGISAGVTNGGQTGDAATFGGNIQGRYAIPNTPLSARGAILFSDETSAIMPMLSYDVPVTNRANVYLGAGYSFVEANGKPTPLGNKDAVVLTTGIEAEASRNIMLYSDVKLGIDAYENTSVPAASFQVGAAYRF